MYPLLWVYPLRSENRYTKVKEEFLPLLCHIDNTIDSRQYCIYMLFREDIDTLAQQRSTQITANNNKNAICNFISEDHFFALHFSNFYKTLKCHNFLPGHDGRKALESFRVQHQKLSSAVNFRRDRSWFNVLNLYPLFRTPLIWRTKLLRIHDKCVSILCCFYFYTELIANSAANRSDKS